MSCTFNLSLDDFAPHQHAGLDFQSISLCNRIIEDFPDLKVNLFVPAAYARLGEAPCYLSEHPDWVDRVNALPSRNYRVNFHGMYHRRHPDDSKFHLGRAPSNNDEWQYLNTPQASELITRMRKEFEKAGLNYGDSPMIFRPCGWKISLEAARAMSNRHINIAGDGRYSTEQQNGSKYLRCNWDMTDPCDIKAGDVLAYGHTSDWNPNYMDSERYDLIMGLLTSRDFHFKFLGE